MDVVYPIGAATEWGHYEELRYSFRSLEKHFPVERIFLIGHKPEWAKNVIHIPQPDCYTSNKDANLINKAIRACLHPELSEEYLWMNDDIILLKDWDHDQQRLPLSVEDLTRTTFANTRHKHRLKATRDVLLKNGRTTWNTEGHCPYVHNKSLFPATMLNYNYGFDNGYTINALYFNAAGIEKNPVPWREAHAEFFQAKSYDEIKAATAGKWHLNFDPTGLTTGMKAYLQERFPEPSRFE